MFIYTLNSKWLVYRFCLTIVFFFFLFSAPEPCCFLWHWLLAAFFHWRRREDCNWLCFYQNVINIHYSAHVYECDTSSDRSRGNRLTSSIRQPALWRNTVLGFCTMWSSSGNGQKEGPWLTLNIEQLWSYSWNHSLGTQCAYNAESDHLSVNKL